MVLCFFVLILKALKITCPILYLTKIPCPTCKMTRAIICLVNLDFSGYVKYNFMSVFVIIAFLLMVHSKLFQNSKIVKIFSISILIINFVYYLIRLFAQGI